MVGTTLAVLLPSTWAPSAIRRRQQIQILDVALLLGLDARGPSTSTVLKRSLPMYNMLDFKSLVIQSHGGDGADLLPRHSQFNFLTCACLSV